MRIYHKNPNNIPVIMSYPRTGCHFVLYMIEKYFDRPTGEDPMLFPETRNDWIFFHDHDRESENFSWPIHLYLYRNPIDTVIAMFYYCQNTTGND